MKCSDCPNQAFPDLDATAVKNHLQGLQTIGTYAITENDACVFLAADFDGGGWQEDIAAYKRAALSLGVHAHIERSRSGKGGHAWVFFTTAIPAKNARRLGTAILSRSFQERHTLNLKSYDRFFPNQDYLPKGGFGNLIALPLQQKAREKENSVFVDESFKPYPNQWEFLALVKRLSLSDVENIIQQTLPKGEPLQNLEEEHITMETDERLMRVDSTENGLGKKMWLFMTIWTHAVALTVSMYRKRLQAYKSMGYQIHAPGHFSSANQGAQSSLFDSRM